MFATWKFDQETSEIQSIRQTYDPVSARSNQHQACDRCHEKKLKCSGDKDGCHRCLSSSVKCEYSRGESRRRKRPTKRSLTINVDRQARETSLSSPGSTYASSFVHSPASSATSFQSSMSRKGSQTFYSPSQSHTSLDCLPSALPYNFALVSGEDDRTPTATACQTSSYMYPAPSHGVTDESFFTGDVWAAKDYPGVTTAALMESTYATMMPPEPQYMPNEYAAYNDYVCGNGQGQQAWDYCR